MATSENKKKHLFKVMIVFENVWEPLKARRSTCLVILVVASCDNLPFIVVKVAKT